MFLQVLKKLGGRFRRIGVKEIRSGNRLGDDDWRLFARSSQTWRPITVHTFWGCAYALTVDDDDGLRGGAWRGASANTL